MNIINRVTLEPLQKNKVRTIVTIIGVTLSTAMITAVTTFASTMVQWSIDATAASEGNWHGRVTNIDYEFYQSILDNASVEETAYVTNLGYGVLTDCTNDLKPYLFVAGGNREVFDLLPIRLTEGRLPENDAELLIPEHVASNGSVYLKIGDKLQLDLGNRVSDGHILDQSVSYQADGRKENLDIRENRSFTVVGFYERLSRTIEANMAPGYTAFTYMEPTASGFLGDVYFRMEKPNDVYDLMRSLDYSGSEYEPFASMEENRELLLCYGVSSHDSFRRILYRLAAITLSLIVFGAVSLIYNAFSISVSERTTQFGLLSYIGATRKQLRHSVLFEALCVSVIGIPLGILSGIIGIGVTLYLLRDVFVSFMPYNIDFSITVSLLSVVTATVVALATILISALIPAKRATKVSAIEAIRQSTDTAVNPKETKTSPLVYKPFGLSGMLASKYYKRSRKKYRATILSLFMSIVLFITAYGLTDSLMNAADGGLNREKYDVDFDYLLREEETDQSEKILMDLRNMKGIDDIAAVQMLYQTGVYDMSCLNNEVEQDMILCENNELDSSKLNIRTYVCFIDDQSFESLCQEYSLSLKDYYDPNNPLAIAIDGTLVFVYQNDQFVNINYLKKGNITISLEKVKELEGYYQGGLITDDKGQILYRYISMEDDSYLDVDPKEVYSWPEVHIGKVIYDKPYYFTSSSNGIRLVYPNSMKEYVLENPSDLNYQFYLLSKDHVNVTTQLSNYMKENKIDHSFIYDRAADDQSTRNLVLIIQVFSYGFIVLISLIAITNVFNTITTNMNLRRREFAMLKSIGMDQKGFNKMMNYECVLYGSKSLLYGLPIACLNTYIIYKTMSIGYVTKFHLPWKAIIISIFIVFTVVFVTMMYFMSKIRKDNVIETLKNENL